MIKQVDHEHQANVHTSDTHRQKQTADEIGLDFLLTGESFLSSPVSFSSLLSSIMPPSPQTISLSIYLCIVPPTPLLGMSSFPFFFYSQILFPFTFSSISAFHVSLAILSPLIFFTLYLFSVRETDEGGGGGKMLRQSNIIVYAEDKDDAI